MKDINATVIVDLTPDEETIFNTLQKDARWGIKKAIKEGLRTEISTTEEDWQEFYNIYVKEITERGVKIETLEHIKKHGDVFFVCKKDERIIAGATIELIEGKPRLSRNASIKEFLKMQPNNLLYWESILWCKRNGYDEFDLGGWQINADEQLARVNKFKERWGKIVYYEKDYPLTIAFGRKILRKFKFLTWINRMRKKL